MATDYRTDTSQDSITADELRLYQLIMEYRQQLGLPIIPLSSSLSIVAGRHVLDDVENEREYDGHSWSDAPYDSADASTYPTIWEAPQRVGTAYPGYGYEISTGYVGPDAILTNTMTPEGALESWQGSPGHNDVIINAGPWGEPWSAIGVGLYKGVAHVWFGHEPDPADNPGSSNPDTGSHLDVFSVATGYDETLVSLTGDTLIVDVGGTEISIDVTKIERVQFTNGTLAFDDEGAAGQSYRIYQAAFARTPDNDGLEFWIGQMDDGMDLQEVSRRFVESAEFRALYASNSTEEYVDALYRNVLGRDGEIAGIQFWVDEISSGRRDQAKALADFSESAENVMGVAPVISDGIWYS